MSAFTINSHPKTPVLVVLEESTPGQVDIVVYDGTERYRIAALGQGKLHIFRLNCSVAEKMCLELDSNNYPVITQV